MTRLSFSGHHQLCRDVPQPREPWHQVLSGDCRTLPAGDRLILQHWQHQVREVKWSVLTQSCCRHYLDTFCSHQMNKRRTEGLDWDHAMLLTGHDLYTSFDRDRASSGMAFLSGMCSKSYSCTISEARCNTLILLFDQMLEHIYKGLLERVPLSSPMSWLTTLESTMMV